MKNKYLFCLILFILSSIYLFPDKKITLTSLVWEPYIGESLTDNGYVAEIVREAFKRVGYTLDIKFYPWARSVAEAEDGKADGLFPEYYDQSRLEKFDYSDSFKGGPVGFLKRKDSKISYKTLKDLSSYTIGTVLGYINTEEFDKAAYLKKEEANSDEINIKKLYAKRLDLIFIDKFVASYIIKTKYPQYDKELEFMEPPLETKPLYIVFSKKSPDYKQKMQDFNKGLKLITNDGTLTKILKKAGI